MKASPDTPHIVVDAAGRMTAPSAALNIDAILRELVPRAPAAGSALEIASGTGQQVVRFAKALPGLHWQPSDIDAARLRSITAWSAGTPSISPPIHLDIASAGWGQRLGPRDLIITVNLLHLIPETSAQACLDQAAEALGQSGLLAIYGPFLRSGQPTSDGDAAFHQRLQAADPTTGYKDVAWVADRLTKAGLTPPEVVAMPSNNLMLFAQKG